MAGPSLSKPQARSSPALLSEPAAQRSGPVAGPTSPSLQRLATAATSASRWGMPQPLMQKRGGAARACCSKQHAQESSRRWRRREAPSREVVVRVHAGRLGRRSWARNAAVAAACTSYWCPQRCSNGPFAEPQGSVHAPREL